MHFMFMYLVPHVVCGGWQLWSQDIWICMFYPMSWDPRRGYYITSVFLRLIFSKNTLADFEKWEISFASRWSCSMKAVSSANMSLCTRIFLIFLADLNCLTLNRFAHGWLYLYFLVGSVKALNKTIKRKIENCVRTKTQSCFSPFPTSNGSENSCL